MRVLLCAILLLVVSRLCSQDIDLSKFKSHWQEYQDFYLFIPAPDSYSSGITILGFQNKQWIIKRVYPKTARQDSVAKSLCTNCGPVFFKELNTVLCFLPSEKELRQPCESLPEYINGVQSLPRSLDNVLHPVYYTILFKVKDYTQQLSYRSPTDAALICPQSKERLQFKKAFELLNSRK